MVVPLLCVKLSIWINGKQLATTTASEKTNLISKVGIGDGSEMGIISEMYRRWGYIGDGDTH
jgi:hypothetical protein